MLMLVSAAIAQPDTTPTTVPTPSVASAVPAARQAQNVAVLTIEGPINAMTARSIERRLRAAEDAGADAVVIELDTPGGEVGAVLEICNTIKSSSIPNTVAWIRPDAYSGGAIIALACREIVASDPASMGDALPIQIGPGGLQALPEAERQKILSPLIAEVVNSARANGWDEYLVQGLVALNVELWYVENIQTGERLCIDEREYRALFEGEPPRSSPRLNSARPMAEPNTSEAPAEVPTATGEGGPAYTPPTPALAGIADDVQQALEVPGQRPTLTEADRGEWTLLGYAADGAGPVVLKRSGASDDFEYFGFLSETINTDEELKAFFGATNLTRVDQSWSENLAALMTNPVIRGILIVVFIIALFLEMASPGIALPGAIAALALLGLLAPPALVGLANWWEIAAIAAGMLLIVLEVFVIPGFGLFGVTGVLFVFLGLLGTFVPDQGGRLFPSSPEAQRDLTYGLATLLLAFTTAGVGLWFVSKRIGAVPIFRRYVMTEDDGPSGTLIDAMRPAHGGLLVGQQGTATTALRPAGKAEFGDDLFDVVSDLGVIDAGEPVRIAALDGFRIVVVPASASDDQQHSDQASTPDGDTA